MASKKKFLRQAWKIVFDYEHRRKIKYNMGRYELAVEKGMLRYKDFEKARDIASAVKTDVVNNLDKYLKQFVDNFERNGGEVFIAPDDKAALAIVERIVEETSAKLVVKSKSMTSEEIGLNEFLESKGLEVVETDLGEFIVQQAGEKPYHIVTPAMHKSKEDIFKLYHQKFGTPLNATVNDITSFTRQYLRERFVRADIGITGANFLVADLGAIALTTNEGNGLMTVAFPKVHIAIVGIEKLLPSYKDLPHFWQILSNRGTGQAITVYSNLVFGPKKADEDNGPERMIIILLDNGRSDLLGVEEQKAALKCIRCGACLNACPVYRNIGGYTYDAVYSGPIGSVLMPFYGGYKQYGHLSFACTLCRKCEEVCPVKIPLPDLILANRRDYVEKHGLAPVTEKLAMRAFEYSVKKPNIFKLGLVGVKNAIIRLTQRWFWTKYRDFPDFKQPFRKQFEKFNKKKQKN